MRIGITVPILNNWSGFAGMLRSLVSYRHHLQFWPVDNSVARLSVAESWNQGCEALFAMGCAAVLVTNDDVFAHEMTIDNMVELWQSRKLDLVTGNNYSGTEIAPDLPTFFSVSVFEPQGESIANPDFSFFLLPKKTWEEMGRFDTNFFPAYFEDNDYYIRLVLAGKRMLRSTRCPIYHVGSVTQFNPSADIRAQQDRVVVPSAFEENREFLKLKWGIDATGEPEVVLRRAHRTPFNDPRLTLQDCPLIRKR